VCAIAESVGANCTDTEFWSLYGGYRIIWWDPAPFGTMVREYWTGTEWPGDRNNAMAQDMKDGGQNDEPKTEHRGAWAVRTIPGGAAPVPMDVWVKDCDADDGSIPSPCTEWWTSPDIYIDNDDDSVIDAPVYGEDNTLKAIVHNKSAAWAMNVGVNFYYRDSSTGLVFPDGANLIGRDFVKIPPNGSAIASTLWRRLPPNPSDGHWCIGVVLYHEDDPPRSPTVAPSEDNNIAVANIWVIAQRQGQRVTLAFAAGTGGTTGFGLQPWPRQFVLKVEDRLPTGWTWSLEGMPADQPFVLKLGDERKVQLRVNVPDGAPPHSGGSIEVSQADVSTGRTVGGVYYNMYEDHCPPESVQRLTVELSGGRPLLSWGRVSREAKTGLKEKVAYYQVLRNGKAVAKVMKDEDRRRPGVQWTDPDPVRGKLTYIVVAVNEAGNRSAPSAKAQIRVPRRTSP
jgi:hypothetical protein